MARKTRRDAGLANDYWKKYYTDEEVEEILANTETTTIISDGLPLHVRIYAQPHPAPTLIVSHGLITYGLALARLQLPFFRAGYNVVQWDMPGFGQSGGARGGCTTHQAIRGWKDAVEWAIQEFSGPYFVTGFGEDGTTCYYAVANHPKISAMAFHNLWEYGDTDVMQWQGPPWMVKVKREIMRVLKVIVPTRTVDMHKVVPWDDLFGREEDAEYRRIFEADPLRNRGYQYALGYSMLKPRKPEVPFEQCTTPVTLIASELNELWLYRMNVRSFNRLGGPKQLITLEGKPHWEFNREFDETFCAHAMRWFAEHGAFAHAQEHAVAANGGDAGQ